VTDRKRTERELLLAHLVRAQEEERLRIASDIHDDTIQAITAAGLRLHLLRRQLTDERQLETLTKLEDTVQLAIGRLRNLMFDLRPPALERDGLAAAVRTYLDQLKTDTGIDGKVEAKLSDEPPLETRANLYRILQESLANVRKHSKAKTVRILLESVAGGYQCTVVDDGIGFEVDQTQARPGHLGLTAMRERAEMVRGRLELTSTPGSGTSLRFWVPRRAASRPEPPNGG
jgi:signal transduction histidine kinase